MKNDKPSQFSPFLHEEKGSTVYVYDEFHKIEVRLKSGKEEKIEAAYAKYEVYLTEEITKASNYTGLCALLREAQPFDVFNFYLANHGGLCHSLINLVNTIHDCKSTVVMHVTAPCSSAASTLALCGDGLVMYPFTHLMFHNYTRGALGKGKELVDDIQASDTWVKDYMRKLHRPFLTAAECSKIENDKDVRIFYNHSDLKDRLERHFK